ncbi:MAG: PD-(D/E)XK nuclease family protein, partial [Nitrospirota bacterium]
GPRTLSSAEVQARDAWQAALASFAGLDAVVPALPWEGAVAWLCRLCAHPFQPEGAEAPVQVMGLREATGLAFDGVWVMGLDSTTLPAPPRPHALLAAHLQRQAGIPASSAAGQLATARRLVAELLALAPEGVVSYPRQRGEAAVEPSPLIADLPPDPEPDPPAVALGLRILGEGRREPIVDEPVPRAEGSMRGGARVIEDQALCPFRAFATHRLHARPLEPAEEEPTPATRGTLVHRCLERIWGELGQQGALLALSEPARLELCRGVATEAVERSRVLASRRPVVGARLAALLGEWLAYEATRAPFAVVATEEELLVEMAGLRLSLRIDRVDRLADGRLLVIDYKTGIVRRGDWWGERPAAPQLPLYTVAPLPWGAVAGVAFAVVRPGECCLVGLGEGIPDVGEVEKARGCPVTDWVALRDQWRTALTGLATAFAAGEAAVDPLPAAGGRPIACQRCDLAALCRIHEAVSADDESE